MCINTKKEPRQISRKHFMDVATFVSSVWICYLWSTSLKTSATCKTHSQDVPWILKLVMLSWNGEKTCAQLDPQIFFPSWRPDDPPPSKRLAINVQGKLNLQISGPLYTRYRNTLVWQILKERSKKIQKNKKTVTMQGGLADT